MPETLIIRADASAAIGTGHVMRCLALAQQWVRAGGSVRFVHASTTPALETRLRAERLPFTRVDASAGSPEDARLTIAAARADNANWVVADGYRFDAVWQRTVKDAGLRLLVLDDYGHASHYHADIVLNQNTSADAALYRHRDPDTRLLLGPRFALLRHEFLATPPAARDFAGPARRILVTLGGSDPDNATGLVIEALRPLPDIEAVVVVGGSNPNLDSLRAAVADVAPAVRLVVNPPNLPGLMAWADLAIAAGGSTSWELAHAGLPSIIVVTADNQTAIAASLHLYGSSQTLGDHRHVSSDLIRGAVRDLVADPARRKIMSARGRRLIDGHGAARVAAALGAPLRITLLSDPGTWLNAYLPELRAGFEQAGHHVRWIHDPAALASGDIAFFLSLSRIVPSDTLRRHPHNLVVHESALPHGRGWSPLTWQVLEGASEIPVSLIEAGEGVDSGEIYAQEFLQLHGHELIAELRAAQAAATLRLCRDFVARFPFVLESARPQSGEATYYPRRRPADSRLDPDKSLREQFPLLRVADPDRYPAFFDLGGRRFAVRLTEIPLPAEAVAS